MHSRQVMEREADLSIAQFLIDADKKHLRSEEGRRRKARDQALANRKLVEGQIEANRAALMNAVVAHKV